MTHLPPAVAVRRTPPPAAVALLGFAALLGYRSHLRAALLDRRAAIARLETEWVAAAEADAAIGRGRTVRMDARETWDGANRDRYLAAASRREPDYMPDLRRPRQRHAAALPPSGRYVRRCYGTLLSAGDNRRRNKPAARLPRTWPTHLPAGPDHLTEARIGAVMDGSRAFREYGETEWADSSAQAVGADPDHRRCLRTLDRRKVEPCTR